MGVRTHSQKRLSATILTTAALFAGAASVAPSQLPRDFGEWAAQHGKEYGTEQALQRALEKFRANEEIIRELNSDHADGAEYGHTRFSDLTPAEFRKIYLPRSMDPAEGRRGGGDMPTEGLLVPPVAVDWRDKGAVSVVRDQASCGSCWAESAVANIESVFYLANNATMKAPVPLSVEQVIECDAHDDACYGGFPKGAYEYAIEHGGLASEAAYPYNVAKHTICLANQTFNATCGDGMCDDPPLTSSCDLKCSDKVHKPVAMISSWKALPACEMHIAAVLAQHGPVSVGMDASGGALGVLFPWLQFYKRGIANPWRCTDTINHAVLLVGYGEEKGQKFWIVKNSWGAKWGESGYFRLVRGAGKCGIASMATTAFVEKAGAASLVV